MPYIICNNDNYLTQDKRMDSQLYIVKKKLLSGRKLTRQIMFVKNIVKLINR